LVSQFSEFSVIFYAIYKNQQNCCTIGVTFLQLRPWKETDVRKVVPMAAGRRGLANSGEAGGLGRAGAGRGGSRGALGLVWGLGPGGNAAGDGARRRWPAAGAARLVPAQCAARREGRRTGELR
jgi:hypothetical protein